ncbi:MAG: SpoIIE family protein phosphatase [Candidatus Riflebacteria bacterium]|nr:SpoIIE family protein phosphatase [Candidatus Riflebacteria bacterium]
MASLNGKPPDPRSSTEVELIAESAMQKTLLEVQHDFIANDGKIDVWGMGTNKSPACINLISINDDRHFDYMLIINWTPHVLEQLYLKRQFLSANRNMVDMQIGLIYEPAGVFLPESFPEKRNMTQQVANFTSKPCPPRQFVTTASGTYLVMGFVGRYLLNYKIFALYPVNSVKSMINKEKAGLVFAGLISLLITIILGQFLTHSFLYPLQKLHAGAEAIRSRDFKMRLPELGRDEFGEMAGIFNTTMVDLEELEVAGAIQEHLLPRRLPECGRFRIFGKIVSIGELGGDYFDYFNTSEGRFSLLIGDVTGRGAGAALIMAMAKAAIMQFSELLEKPDEVARNLHNLIRDTARGTQKTMIMQYLNLNATDGTGVYTNAGGWPPLIVNPHDRSVREVALPGPMLGALKKPRFGMAELELKTDEAIIFYSDGVIEARNEAEEAIGLERLKQLAIAAWNPDPEAYFANLLAAHRQFTGKAAVRDDMTFLIAVSGEPHPPEQEPV